MRSHTVIYKIIVIIITSLSWPSTHLLDLFYALSTMDQLEPLLKVAVYLDRPKIVLAILSGNDPCKL